jgi:5-methylcytosine-specific restriction endonuclease McrA
MKTCRRCHQLKSLDQFRRVKRNKNRPHSWCMPCCSLYRREQWKKSYSTEEFRVKHRESSAKWKRDNPDRLMDWHRRNWTKVLLYGSKRRALIRGLQQIDFTHKQWLDMIEKTGGRCVYCGQVKKLTVDHVIPISKGGQHTKSNIVPACQSCNSRKKDGPAPPFVVYSLTTDTP